VNIAICICIFSARFESLLSGPAEILAYAVSLALSVHFWNSSEMDAGILPEYQECADSISDICRRVVKMVIRQQV
jgi:hypothetical protein